MDDVVAEVREFLREAQLRLAAAQALVGLLAQRDVADEADEARRLAPGTWPTASSHGKMAPSLRRARTSRPMPMMRASPVCW